MRTRRGRAAACGAGLALATGGLAAPALAAHDPNFPQSSGIYRIPYSDGTIVDVWQDQHTHGPVDRVDLSAGTGQQVVAAAGGWVRYIQDHNGDTLDRGDGLAHDLENPAGPTSQNDMLEHACGNNNPDPEAMPPDPPNPILGSCTLYNNYVWLEHPNGEWSKYTHLGTGTPTIEAGLTIGEWVDAGQLLGFEDDIGQASGSPSASHLHFELAVILDPTVTMLPLDSPKNGFFASGAAMNVVPRTCDGDGGWFLYDVDVDDLEADDCNHDAPVADAGGPYIVDEGEELTLDGSGSSDPEGAPLTYRWTPEGLGIDPVEEPTLTVADDFLGILTLSVYDQVEAIAASDTALLVVQNVAPTVTIAGGAPIDEGGTVAVSATFHDPGGDQHTIEIDWGDGGPVSEVPNEDVLEGGLGHTYGDNGTYPVTVTVTDDDEGVGSDTVEVTVSNVDPEVELSVSNTVAFPGGDYPVAGAGETLEGSADGVDAGSDDLTFTWSSGPEHVHFNNGSTPDEPMSPFGVYPFEVTDTTDATFGTPGVAEVSLSLADDDGGSTAAAAEVVVTGTASSTFGAGWWMHQYSGAGSPHIDQDLAQAYLDVVAAVSSVFSEVRPLSTPAMAHDVLSPPDEDPRAQAEAELLNAWLHFASGAVGWDAVVTVPGGGDVALLDLIGAAEETILDPLASDAELREVAQHLRAVLHATG